MKVTTDNFFLKQSNSQKIASPKNERDKSVTNGNVLINSSKNN